MKITKVRFFEYGKLPPKNSRYQGTISDKTVAGYFDYTGREEAKDVAKEINEQEKGYFGYTGSHTVGTFSSIGELQSAEDRKKFKNEINTYFNEDGNLCWDFVISLEDDEEAERLGLNTPEGWSSAMDDALPKIFKQYGLDINNALWWFDIHRNTNHPHIHLAFMEKNQTRFRGKVTKQELENTKKFIYTSIAARMNLKQNTGLDYKEFFKSKDESFAQLVLYIKDKDLSQIKGLKELCRSLPKSGRLQYNSYNMKSYKKAIDNVIKNIIESDEELKKEYDCFVHKLDLLEEAMRDDGNQYGHIKQRELDKFFERIGNYILQNYKKNEYVLLEKSKDHNKPDLKRKNFRTKRYLNEKRLKGFVYSIAVEEQMKIDKAIEEYNQRMENNLII